MRHHIVALSLFAAACSSKPTPMPQAATMPDEITNQDLTSNDRMDEFYNIPIQVPPNVRLRGIKQDILRSFTVDYIADSSETTTIQCDFFADRNPNARSVINGSGDDDWNASKYSTVHHGEISITAVGPIRSGRCWTRPGHTFSL